jgi:hypothetical protein
MRSYPGALPQELPPLFVWRAVSCGNTLYIYIKEEIHTVKESFDTEKIKKGWF